MRCTTPASPSALSALRTRRGRWRRTRSSGDAPVAVGFGGLRARATARTRQICDGRATPDRTRSDGQARSSRVSRRPVRARYSRAHDELVRAVTAEPADFVYGGTTGALAAVGGGGRPSAGSVTGSIWKTFTRASGAPGRGRSARSQNASNGVLPGAAFLTTSSPMIADAYADKYGLRPRPSTTPSRSTCRDRRAIRDG